LRVPQGEHAEAHESESEQRPDADQLADQTNRQQPGKDGHDNAGHDRGDVWRAKARVHFGGDRRQQPIARHGVEDPRLRQQHDENDRGQPEDGAELDDGCKPFQAEAFFGYSALPGDCCENNLSAVIED
jgi:hypothetical protein